MVEWVERSAGISAAKNMCVPKHTNYGILVMTNKLLHTIERNVTRGFSSCDTLFVDLMNCSEYSDLLYNGMVIIVYKSEHLYVDHCATLENCSNLFVNSENRIHHILHIVETIENTRVNTGFNSEVKFIVKRWKSSAGGQTIHTHTHMNQVLQDLILYVLQNISFSLMDVSC